MTHFLQRSPYPPSLKRELAVRYLAGEFSYTVAAQDFGLQRAETAKEFVRWYKRLVASEDAD